MKTEVEKIQVLSLKSEGLSYKDKYKAKITSFFKDCVKGRYLMRKVLIKKKTGPKPKINSVSKLRFKRQISTLQARSEKAKLRQTQIGNMDEVPMNFDMVGNRIVDTKGKMTIFVKTTGNDKTRFTVILTCMADGTKLKPMIIFKRKLMPKIKFSLEVFVHVHEKG